MGMNAHAQDFAGKRILFGHQSVGQGIVEGLRALLPHGRIVPLDAAAPAPGAAGELAHFRVGRNGDPASKDASFAAALGRTGSLPGAVAMYKYCYADVDYASDAEQMFAAYWQHTRALQRRFPQTTFVHITIPLTTAEPGWKAGLKSALGRDTLRELCVKRHQFNALLRAQCGANHPIFDLADAESTRPDGSRSCFPCCGRPVHTLAAEYTSDGGHLNELGRRVAASRLLDTLASL